MYIFLYICIFVLSQLRIPATTIDVFGRSFVCTVSFQSEHDLSEVHTNSRASDQAATLMDIVFQAAAKLRWRLQWKSKNKREKEKMLFSVFIMFHLFFIHYYVHPTPFDYCGGGRTVTVLFFLFSVFSFVCFVYFALFFLWPADMKRCLELNTFLTCRAVSIWFHFQGFQAETLSWVTPSLSREAQLVPSTSLGTPATAAAGTTDPTHTSRNLALWWLSKLALHLLLVSDGQSISELLN